jgi:hypothetical protein
VSEWLNGTCSRNGTLQIEERKNDNDHGVWIKSFTKVSRIQGYIAEWYALFICLGIRNTYELQRSDGGPKYEKWLKSHKILY